MCSFFAENGSIDGGMTARRSRGTHDGANCARENTNASTSSRYGRRKSHARSECSFCVSMPTWQRHTTLHARARELRREPGGLRVVQDHDVAGANDRVRRVATLRRIDLVVVAMLGRAQRTAVAGGPVEMIVDAFGDLEEAGVAVDDDPASVDARALGVREQRLQELGDAATGRGRVHVDDAPSGEPRARGVGGRA